MARSCRLTCLRFLVASMAIGQPGREKRRNELVTDPRLHADSIQSVAGSNISPLTKLSAIGQLSLPTYRP